MRLPFQVETRMVHRMDHERTHGGHDGVVLGCGGGRYRRRGDRQRNVAEASANAAAAAIAPSK